MTATVPTDSPWALPPAVVATRPHRLPTGHTVQLWAPAGEGAHPAGWYRPAVELCATFATSTVWRLAVTDLSYLGRVDRPGAPSLWLYRHRGGEVLVDVDGCPWVLVDDERRRAGYRAEPADLAAVAADLGLRSERGTTDDDTGEGAVVLPFRRS